ncbi:hypothetical protein GCM10009839_67080 [Catenulispora yoronensis]|uniref:Uncharacterized protein n=1 Tax=Catenulispora yoronensis TaxID=450799 RepID=A0ABN2V434_9ACTN
MGFDVNAALKKAGIAATAKPGEEGRSDTAAVDADSTTNAQADSPLKQRGASILTCHYTLSTGGYLTAAVAGVHTGTAISLMAPLLQHDGQISRSDLETYITQKFTAGHALTSPGGGLVAVAKLDASGGDALVEVTSEAVDTNADHGPLVGEPLRALTDALAKQVKV